MLKNLSGQLFKLTQHRLPLEVEETSRKWAPLIGFYSPSRALRSGQSGDDVQESDAKELIKQSPREIFAKEFPEYYTNEGFVGRSSYVDFIDQALDRMKELGQERNIEAYKELLRIFPKDKYNPGMRWSFGLYHAPQQLCVVRLLHQMESNLVKPDKDIERLVVGIFGIQSDAWLKVARQNYWSMKGRNVDPNPLPEVIPEKPHELAKIAISRMTADIRSLVIVKNTSSLPDAIDKTWVVYTQSPSQQSIIENLDENSILYLEESGFSYVDKKYLTYYTLKVYEDEEKTKKRATPPKPDYNYNTLKMKFYGKPIREKLEEMQDIHLVDNSHILAVGMTGTSSHDSLLSWLKFMQQRNPRLSKLSVVFRLKRPTNDVIDPETDPQMKDEKERKKSSNISG